MLSSLCECFYCVKEIALCLLVTIDDGLLWILWKCRILDDELVQVVSQKISASISSMAIKDSEETALGPVGDILLSWRLHDVQNDTNPILIIVSDDSLVGICSIPHDVSILSHTALCWLPHR